MPTPNPALPPEPRTHRSHPALSASQQPTGLHPFPTHRRPNPKAHLNSRMAGRSMRRLPGAMRHLGRHLCRRSGWKIGLHPDPHSKRSCLGTRPACRPGRLPCRPSRHSHRSTCRRRHPCTAPWRMPAHRCCRLLGPERQNSIARCPIRKSRADRHRTRRRCLGSRRSHPIARTRRARMTAPQSHQLLWVSVYRTRRAFGRLELDLDHSLRHPDGQRALRCAPCPPWGRAARRPWPHHRRIQRKPAASRHTHSERRRERSCRRAPLDHPRGADAKSARAHGVPKNLVAIASKSSWVRARFASMICSLRASRFSGRNDGRMR